jgi:hypothetical protein
MRIINPLKIKCATICICFLCTPMTSQLYQTIRGTVNDADSKMPIAGAAVILQNTDPVKAVLSDNEGQFKFTQITVGRQEVKVTMLGYDSRTLSELLLTTGKELVLNIELKESLTNIDEVVVKAQGKDKPINTMSMVSARAFTVEETQRYAGGLDDPGRLASVFAGVSDGNIESNGIVVRGNAPTGAIYRIEGVEVMNPNHFAGEDLLGGGFVSLISNQVLDNSDFLTGAFPAEYGNALSAVFDMNLRKGNAEKSEHTFQAGLIGLDFASEGPFSSKNKASYLFNYRYSTFGLVQNFLPAGEGLPIYQDLCFNINIPIKQSSVSVWGVGGTDGYTFKKLIDDKYQSGVVGIKSKLVFKNNLYVNTTFAANVFVKRNRWFEQYQSQYYPKSKIDNIEGSYTFSTYLNKKFNRRYTNRTGLSIKNMFFDLDNNLSLITPQPMQQINQGKGNCNLIQVYTQMKTSVTEKIMLNTGLHLQYLSLNNEYSIEPRIGVKYALNEKHAFSVAYGLHSQMSLLSIYFVKNPVIIGPNNPNKNLGFIKANHFVLGYDWNISSSLRLKVEPFFQYLYNVPVIADSSFSLLNLDMGNEFQAILVKKGKGQNYGIDITFERFLNNGFYYLATASLFQSKYAGGDNVWRNTKFNKNFVANLLGGKEWNIDKSKKNKIIGINGRLYIKGGDRVGRINEMLSVAKEKVVFDESHAFENQLSPSYRFDVSLSYRINRPTFSHVWALQVMNVTYASINNYYKYNNTKQQVDKLEERFVLPSLSWKVEF